MIDAKTIGFWFLAALILLAFIGVGLVALLSVIALVVEFVRDIKYDIKCKRARRLRIKPPDAETLERIKGYIPDIERVIKEGLKNGGIPGAKMVEAGPDPLLVERGFIIITYNRFLKMTAVFTDVHILGVVNPYDHPVLRVVIYCEGKKVCKESVGVVIISFTSMSSYWKYLSNHRVRCLADGEVLHLPKEWYHKERVLPHDPFKEWVFIWIDYPTLEKMWNATTLKFLIGGDQFTPGEIEMYMLPKLKALFVK